MSELTVECLVHGPMKYRFALDWWECLGFDGEGCAVQLVYAEDVARGAGSGIPGVRVRSNVLSHPLGGSARARLRADASIRP